MDAGVRVRNRLWSTRDDAILSKHYGILPTRHIAKWLERSTKACNFRAQAIGIPFNRRMEQ